MMFHGTRRACRIAESATDTTACHRDDCNLCRILKGSYNMERAKGKRMFGPGIYSTSVSSKADDYTSNANDWTKTRVMIVNHVAVGRTKMMYEACHDMQHAPHLYNSVCFSPLFYLFLVYVTMESRSLALLMQKVENLIIKKLSSIGTTRYVQTLLSCMNKLVLHHISLVHSKCFSKCCRIKFEISFFTESGIDAVKVKVIRAISTGKNSTFYSRSSFLEQQLK